MKPSLIPVILLTLLLTACASAPTPTGSSNLMGLDDSQVEAAWAQWTPAPHSGVPQGFVDEVVAFDYWQIDSAEVVDEAWSGMSALLDYLRRDGLDDAQRDTVTALLQALDSDRAIMDVTFVVSLDADRAAEGLVVRIYRRLEETSEDEPGATASVAVYLERPEQPSAGFERAVMWAAAGFEQPRPFTVSLERADGDWSVRKFDDALYPTPADDATSIDGAAELASDIFERAFWTPFVGPAFVEAIPRAEDEAPTPAPIEPALGLELRERQLEEVYRDTVFPPRMDTTPFSRKSL
jgi:hypothetical protein